jgi:hypothetical protein
VERTKAIRAEPVGADNQDARLSCNFERVRGSGGAVLVATSALHDLPKDCHRPGEDVIVGERPPVGKIRCAGRSAAAHDTVSPSADHSDNPSK